MTDPNDLEGTRAPEELAENFRELNRIAPTPADRFKLMLSTMNADLPANLPPLPPDPTCGHCGKPRSKHFDEDQLYCTKTTTGDLFSEEPNDDFVLEMFSEEQIEDAKHRWKAANGHAIEAVRDEPTKCNACHGVGGHMGDVCARCKGSGEDQPASGEADERKAWFIASAHLEDGCEITAGSPDMLRAFGELPPATGTEASACEDALAPFRNVARGIPDNWPGQCILRFDQRGDGSIFLSYHGINDASGGITINQWRALLDERRAK